MTFRLGRMLACGVLFGTLASCAGGSANHDCNDGIDNDADGLFDDNDPGCLVNGDTEAPDPDFPACSDGVDNDGDGLSDYPDDLGCVSADDDDEYDVRQPQCNDGIDNDGDGRTDYPNDPGCFLSLENDEKDDCPDGPNCPACANGIDDDNDGLIDYGAAADNDPGCDRAGDNDEFNADPGICGNVQLTTLPADGIASGSATANSTNELISASCGGSGAESVYSINITEPTSLYVTTDFAETSLDTVVYVRSDCRDPETELGCNDDSEGVTSTLLVDLDPGAYFIVVDAHNAGSGGNFKVAVTEFIPQGEECDPLAPMCAPGLVCRKWTADSPHETCELPRCSDGADNDADSLSDFPDDPGCTALDDNEEDDSCSEEPVGADCPACGNGVDDDADGLIDYAGGDLGCSSASDNNEIDECIPGVDVLDLPPGGVTGTTSGVSNFVGSCAYGSYPEDVYALKVDRDLLSLTFSTLGSTIDTVTYVRLESCDLASAEVACADPDSAGEEVVITAPVNGGTYFVFVDGDYVSGDYVLNATGIIAGGDPCGPTDTQFICESGFYCDAVSELCEGAACNDGADNDSDGHADYPADPGCENISDNDETDDCPSGPTCPQCGNEIDDDADGAIDWGDDPGCAAAGDNVEDDCPGESDTVEVITTAATSGTTVGLTNDFTPSCSSYSTAPEKVFVLTVPGKLSSLTVDTESAVTDLDSIIYIKADECSTADLACDDDGGVSSGSSLIELTDLDPGSYLIFVDGYSSGSDIFTLNVSGIIRGGESCDADQVAAGIFTCASGYFCDGTACIPAECNDGISNDADGLADYPDDPGCDSPSDSDETDDCPTGPGCPACSDETDNDADGLIDYGSDPGCTAASDDLEIDECIPGVEIEILTDDGVIGTTPPSTAGSNFTPSCNFSTSSTEDVYLYQLDRPLLDLTFSTLDSTTDTVTAVRFDDCGDLAAEVGCMNGLVGEEVTIADPATGRYYVFIDGDYYSEIDYILDVFGTVAAGESCDPVSTNFLCEAGYTCPTDTCVTAACNNGDDDDSDSLTDYPNDPGCVDSSDNDESDDCPDGAGCPECSNGLDDDDDGDFDYPDDTGCSSAADDDEIDCEDSDPILDFTASPATGTTVGATNDWVPSCQSSNSLDVVYKLPVPGDLNSLSITTDGSAFDTVLILFKDMCTGAEYGCDDDGGYSLQSLISLTSVPAGNYFIVVDGYSTNTGAYELAVSGEITSGQPCDPAQTFLTCEGATTCTDPGTGFVCN